MQADVPGVGEVGGASSTGDYWLFNIIVSILFLRRIEGRSGNNPNNVRDVPWVLIDENDHVFHI